MKPLLLFALLWLGVPPACHAGDPPPTTATQSAHDKARAEFVGTWEFVSVAPQGVTKEATQLVFRADGSYAALDKQGKELWGGTYEIDSTTTPHIWDHRSHAGKTKGDDVLGIYRIAGDKLTACCVVGSWKEQQWTGKPRPQKFQVEGADVLLELRRVSPEK